MAQDIFGNEVGKVAVFKAGKASIDISGAGQAIVTSVQINYSVPLQPVAVFGNDAIFAQGTPQGSFAFGAMAGTSEFANELENDGCTFKSVGVTFDAGQCNGVTFTINGRQTSLKTKRKVVMHGTVFSNFAISGTAQDSFFSENVGGVFHYLSKN